MWYNIKVCELLYIFTGRKAKSDMITKDQVKNLADLSRLYVSEEDLNKYSREMEDIIALMDTIGDSDFEYNLIEKETAVPYSSLRRDLEVKFSDMDKIVGEGPETIENMFVVPKVVE